MTSRTAALRPFAACALALGLLAAPLASAGFVTQSGSQRVVHLEDRANGVEIAVTANETLDSNHDNYFVFSAVGSNTTAASTYTVVVAISPDDPDIGVSWNASVQVPAGAGTTAGAVLVPHDYPPGTLSNVPFRFLLKSAGGTVLDSTDAGIDVRYHTPPADGGLLQLALATSAFWALVFLYALHLHSNERKLRARAEALERSMQGRAADDPATGPKR